MLQEHTRLARDERRARILGIMADVHLPDPARLISDRTLHLLTKLTPSG